MLIIMKSVLCIILSLALLAQAASAVPDVLVVNFDINKIDIVAFREIKPDTGMPSLLPEGDYQVELLDKEKKALSSRYFPISFYRGEPLEPVNVTNVYLQLQYHPDIAYVKILHNNKTIAFERVDFCDSNGVCDVDKGEFYLNCPSDCPSGSNDTYCDKAEDGKCDPDCSPQTDKDCPLVEPSTAYTIAIIAGALILAGIAYYLLRKRQWQGIYEKYRYRVR